MKFINLTFEGVANQKAAVNFSDKVAGGLAVADVDANALKEALSFGLYGGGHERLTAPAKAELTLEAEDEVYTVIRLYAQGEEGAEPEESAAVTNYEKSEILAEGAEAVNDFILSKIHFTKKAFDNLYVLDRKELSEKLSSDSITRESFIAEELGKLITAEEIKADYKALTDAEKQLLEHVDFIEPVTRKEIKEYKMVVETNQIEVDNIRKDITETCDDIAKIKRYESDTEDYYAESGALERILAKSAAIESKIQLTEKSEKASEVIAIYSDYVSIKEDMAAAKAELDKKYAALKDAEDSAANAEISSKKLEKDFIYANEKAEELEKALRNLIRTGIDSPEDYKLDEGIARYYAETDAKVAEYSEKKAALDDEYEALLVSTAELEAKKIRNRFSADYKKAVQDAAIIESDLRSLDANLKESDAVLRALDEKQNALYEEHTALSGKISELNAAQAKLDKKIRGNHPDFKKAVNADVVYKQTLYAKHLIASAHEVELDAVYKKIESVKKATAHYDERLSAADVNKKELEDHISKLTARHSLLSEKLTDFMSVNKLKDLTEDIDYGARCPVCDGFVTVKKQFDSRDTKAIEAQLSSISEEIAKSEATLKSILESVGQYGAAKKVSESYLENLEETAAAKKSIIDGILADFGVGSVSALVNKLKNVIQRSNELVLNIDLYRENEVKLAALTEADRRVTDAYDSLEKETVPKEKEKYAKLSEELKEKTTAYEKYQTVLNGENAEELLLKLQVVNKEYETIEAELEEKQKRIKALIADREELLKVITVLGLRGVEVEADGKNLSYREVITRVVCRDLYRLVEEIDANEENKDITKVRLAGLKKIAARINEEKTLLSEETAAEKARIDSALKVAEEMYGKYEDKVKALGIQNIEELKALILDESAMNAYNTEIKEYDEAVVKVKEAINKLKNAIAVNQPYFDSKELITGHYEELKQKENDAILVLGESESIYSEMIGRYEDLIESNKRLAHLQARIKKIEDMSPALAEDAILAKDFCKIVVDNAISKVKNWTNDNYYFELREDGSIALINAKKGKEVRADKMTREEKMIVSLGLPSAYADAASALLGVEYNGVIELAPEESDKQSVAVLAEAGKEQELAVVPSDEAVFMRSASKLI